MANNLIDAPKPIEIPKIPVEANHMRLPRLGNGLQRKRFFGMQIHLEYLNVLRETHVMRLYKKQPINRL